MRFGVSTPPSAQVSKCLPRLSLALACPCLTWRNKHPPPQPFVTCCIGIIRFSNKLLAVSDLPIYMASDTFHMVVRGCVLHSQKM
jgi:hypothetical protein